MPNTVQNLFFSKMLPVLLSCLASEKIEGLAEALSQALFFSMVLSSETSIRNPSQKLPLAEFIWSMLLSEPRSQMPLPPSVAIFLKRIFSEPPAIWKLRLLLAAVLPLRMVPLEFSSKNPQVLLSLDVFPSRVLPESFRTRNP